MKFKVKNLQGREAEIEAKEPTDIIEARAKGKMTAQSAVQAFRALVEEKFPQSKIREMIEELAGASDKKATKNGEFYDTSNWTARYNALKEVMKLEGLLSGDKTLTPGMAPTKVQVNIINPETLERNRG